MYQCISVYTHRHTALPKWIKHKTSCSLVIGFGILFTCIILFFIFIYIPADCLKNLKIWWNYVLSYRLCHFSDVTPRLVI